MVSARNSFKVQDINQRVGRGEEMTDRDMTFLYGLDGSVETLNFYGLPTVYATIGGRDWRKDLVRLAEITRNSKDNRRLVQAGILDSLVHVMQGTEQKSEVPAEALGVLYNLSEHATGLLCGPIREKIKEISNKRHYGADFMRVQTYEKGLLEEIDKKVANEEELDTADLELLYEPVTFLAPANHHLAESIMIRRDVKADVARLLQAAPKYEIFREGLEAEANTAARIIDIYNRASRFQPITMEEAAFMASSRRSGEAKTFSALYDFERHRIFSAAAYVEREEEI